MPATRWGIAGCGKISSDFVNALQHQGSSKHIVVAVAARSLESAEAFANKFGVEKFYGHYDALAEDSEIDLVYVGVINPGHFAVVTGLLNARKPVLCEKPLTVRLSDTQQLLTLAKQQNTFLMEGVWARYFPVYREAKRRVQASEIGELTHAYTTFGVPIQHVERVSKKELGGGSVLDIGVYALSFILYMFGDERPVEVKTTGTVNEEGVEADVTCLLKFSKERFGTFILSTRGLMPNEAFLCGTKGSMKIGSPFWCPVELTGPTRELSSYPLDETDRTYNFNNSQGLKYEADEVASNLHRGDKENSTMPHSTSLLLAELMQAIRQQLGVQC